MNPKLCHDEVLLQYSSNNRSGFVARFRARLLLPSPPAPAAAAAPTTVAGDVLVPRFGANTVCTGVTVQGSSFEKDPFFPPRAVHCCNERTKTRIHPP